MELGTPPESPELGKSEWARPGALSPPLSIRRYKCDQIGQLFAYWAIGYFGQFFKTTQLA
jgi:hypothetical protein